MDKIKGQLAGVAALLGVIAAIGGGFVKYGEITTKLKVLEGASKSIDMSFLSEIKVLEEKVNKLENVDTTHSHNVGEHIHDVGEHIHDTDCLLYTSPSPRDGLLSRMPSSA